MRKFPSRFVLIKLQKLKGHDFLYQFSSIRIHVEMHEGTNISIRFNMRGHGSNEYPHSCSLVRTQKDPAHRENACSCFVGVQKSLIRCDVKQIYQSGLKYPNETVSEYWLEVFAWDLWVGIVCS